MRKLLSLGLALLCPLLARGAEHVTLSNGFAMECSHHEMVPGSGMVRLYPLSKSTLVSGDNYIEVQADAIRMVEPVLEMPSPAEIHTPEARLTRSVSISGTALEVKSLLAAAGEKHHIDADLLAAVVKAESGGQIRAVSRAGAQGLMQLMPATAATLGVKDAFRPEQNIAGGTAYLDQLLTRYHDDVALALAAYNAGPGAVDKFHGIPPYRETRAYVARIITEFNRRKKAALTLAAK